MGSVGARQFFFSAVKEVHGAFLKDENIYFKNNGDIQKLLSVKKYKLKGRHNLENLIAGLLAARLSGVKNFPPISKFAVPSHRLEEVAVINEVVYINDSKATNMDSVYRAIESLQGPVILLAGDGSFSSINIKLPPCPFISFFES